MRNQFRLLLTSLLSLFLLWILFRGTNWGELAQAITAADVRWLLIAVVLVFASLVVRVQRWAYVVRATHAASFRAMFSATQIGLLVNLLVPIRIGDLVKGFLLARLERISVAQCLTLVALDRINDLLALIVVLLIAALAIPAQADVVIAAGAFGNANPIVMQPSLVEPVAAGLAGACLFALGLMALLYFRQDAVLKLISFIVDPRFPRAGAWLHATTVNIADGMHVFRSAATLAKAVLLSLATWGLSALSLGALIVAFQLQCPWFAPIVILAVLGIFTSVTVTPGMIGQYHVPIVGGLLMTVPLLNLNEAKAMAIVAHLVAVVPVAALGMYSMLREQLGVRDLLPRDRQRLAPND